MSTLALRHYLRSRVGVLIACMLVISGCTGVIIEPTDNVGLPASGLLEVRGYTVDPSTTVSIEAINSSNAWETIGTAMSGTRKTYTGTKSGYYWELAFYPRSLAARFRVAGKVRIRAKVGNTLLLTRSAWEQRPRVEDSPLVELWNAYNNTSAGSVITVWL